MRVLLTSEAKFERTPDGKIWGPAACGQAIWRRYLNVFSSALVAARVADVRQPSDGCVEASGEGIAFSALPAYSGLEGLLRHSRLVRAAVDQAVGCCPAVIVRSPSPVAFLAAGVVSAAGRPYGAHLVGDPDQVFSIGAFRHPLRAPIRKLATSAQRWLSRHAAAVLFVTREALQRKYPTHGCVYSSSDVALDDDAFKAIPPRGSAPFTLVTVGTLDQPYKGTALLLDAVARLRQQSAMVRVRIVGSGRLMPSLRSRAHMLGLESSAEFLGQLDRAGVQRALDSADLFVLPSLTEGLPRALLEAMARGLPAVASAVGGVPELLAPEWLVPAGDAPALAERIHQAMAADGARAAAGKRNQAVAREYHEHEQTVIRTAFCVSVRDAAAAARRESAHA